MSRITLAFACFFRLLFGGSLPAKAAKFLPEPEPTPDPKPEPKAASKESSEIAAKPEAAKKSAKQQTAKQHEEASLALLSLLQREGRLIDFLQEEIEEFEDADIGAAVRDIHRGCRRVIKEYLTLEAVMPGAEDDEVTIREGFDPHRIKLTGEVVGDPPFSGVLRHHGWRASKCNFPKLTGEVDRSVLAPAEVEVGK